MARVNPRLRVRHRREHEGTLSKNEVHDVDTACVSCRVNPPNCLVEHQQEEAEESGECVVCREALCAFVGVVRNNLEG